MSEEMAQPSESTEAATEATTETTEAVVTDNGEATDQVVTYANGKYTTVSDLEKGYTELQKSYSQKLGGFSGAPEAYELAEGIEVTPRLEALQAWGKENQLSNEALNSIIEMDTEATQAANEAYVAEQKELLGKNADERLSNIQDWARATVGEDNMDVFNGMITSAAGAEMMESLMKQMQGTAPAPAQARQVVDKDQVKAMRFAKDEFGNRKMSVDPAYRAKVEALEAELFTK